MTEQAIEQTGKTRRGNIPQTRPQDGSVDHQSAKPMNELDNNTAPKDPALEYWERLLLWQTSETYFNYQVVPFLERNGDFGVQIYTPNGLNLKRVGGLKSIEETLTTGKQAVERAINIIQRESLLDQLINQGFMTDGEVRHVLKNLPG